MEGLKVWLRLHFGVSGSVVVESVRPSDARFDIRLTVKKKTSLRSKLLGINGAKLIDRLADDVDDTAQPNARTGASRLFALGHRALLEKKSFSLASLCPCH